MRQHTSRSATVRRTRSRQLSIAQRRHLDRTPRRFRLSRIELRQQPRHRHHHPRLDLLNQRSGELDDRDLHTLFEWRHQSHRRLLLNKRNVRRRGQRVGTATQGQSAFYKAAGTTLFATSSLFLSPSGYIGIGTTAPISTLSVVSSTTDPLDITNPNIGYLFHIYARGQYKYWFDVNLRNIECSIEWNRR